ncbi:ABC transporter ATP-binding protein [Chelativorans sp. Marseille-P2723]|uniref:ABC transporter ATP-binding protein n=1 Tax=Chelativorans sp. Marseille-P2723 TaxID=2709133 RepID=UPI00157095B2|nr:ABC transporter ATP-binding protein [Chelativorans sp. Marseille-P2723]
MTISISCRGLGKTYHSRSGDVRALEPVDLEVKPGEFLVLIGPSGCGKTTLMRIIGGLQSASEGTLKLTTGPDGRDTVGFVFQQSNLLPWMTIEDNVALPLRLRHIGKQERRERAVELCNKVGLAGFERRWPRELSGGMQQRAAIARALADDPALLLMDEPFGALDALTRTRLNSELERLWMASGATVVLVTHSISEAVMLADRIVVMSARPGRIRSITQVPFERPRPVSLEGTAEFQAIASELRAQLDQTA